MKIGLIVEGDSDKLFFEHYFKPKFKKDITVTSSGGKGCRILSKPSMHKDIKALFERGCEKVLILVDLDTQCTTGVKFTCILELKEWYKKKISIDDFKNTIVSVVSKEIEAWMLSAWERSDSKSKEDLKKKFPSRKSLNEKELFKKFLTSKKDIDYTKNESLKYFLCKLELLDKEICK
ncbi:MAG: DUF4276 family protein [Campylobacterota bacterium]|nr:DUF4276 family protein [Campylobacterota bacterium]